MENQKINMFEKQKNSIISNNTSENFKYIPEKFRYTSEFINQIIINTTTYTILKDLGEINGIRNYIVKHGNAMYGFRWYSKKRFKNYCFAEETLLYVTHNDEIKKIAFIPDKILKNQNGFGYITTLPNNNYHHFKNIIQNKSRFITLNQIEDTAINLITLFEKLSKYNLQLYNFNENNLLVNMRTGDIFLDVINTFTISNTINCAITYEYLAPETNIHNVLTQDSTRYSLMVILFRLFYHDHPLDGYNVVSNIDVTPFSSKKWYSDKAVFNMSSKDTSNHVVRGVHYQLLSLWNKYPNYIKFKFSDFFENYLQNPKGRYSYNDILLIFKHLKIMTINCSCGYTDFFKNIRFNNNSFSCNKCRKNIDYLYFSSTKRLIPIKVKSVIYLSFVTKDYNVDTELGIIISSEENNSIGSLKNLTDVPWKYSAPNGNVKIINPKESALLIDNALIDIGYTIISVNTTVTNAQK